MKYSSRFLKILLAIGVALIVVGGVMILMPPQATVAFKCMDTANRCVPTELIKLGLERAVSLL